MSSNPEDLVRLRANPRLVRVSVRRVGSHWRASVQSGNYLTFTTREDASDAVEAALLEAAACRFPGVDLNCQWTYPHPQRSAS